MNAERLDDVYDYSLYLIVLLPVVPLMGSDTLPLIPALLYLAVLAGSWFAHRAGVGRNIPERAWNALVLMFVVVSLGRVFLTETSALDTVVQLLLVLTIVKLFGRLSARDELQVFVLSLITLAASTTLTDELLFGVAFSAYVLVGTFSLAVFHLRNEVQQRPKISFRGIPTLNKSYASVLAAMSAVVLAASLGIFFTFPRIGLGFFAPKERDAMQMVGFSESVELGNHGVIRDNPSVVMRVEFPQKPASTSHYHWRIMAFDHYDGRAWSRTRNERRRGVPIVQDDDPVRVAGLPTRQYAQNLAKMYDGTGPTTKMQVYLEPLGTDLLPTLWTSKMVRLGSDTVSVPFGPRSGKVLVDGYGDLHHTVEDQVGMTYQLWAWQEGTSLSVDAPGRAYLQLPDFSPRVAQLAAQVAPADASAEQAAQALESYFQRNFSYTTDLPEVGANPVESFLFDAKRGHCEYFATSTVMLLRARGIPARIVNGFLGGSWNNVGNYLAVRQGDAHTWVEYWHDGAWRMLDPTPTSAAGSDSGVIAAAREYYDALKLFWTKWIIEYDLNAQVEIFRRLSATFKSSESSTNQPDADQETERPTLGWGPPALSILVFAGGWLLTRRARLRRWKPGPTAALLVGGVGLSAGATFWFFDLNWGAANLVVGLAGGAAGWWLTRKIAPLTAAWLDLEVAATRLGIQRGPDEGPDAFLRRLGASIPELAGEIEAFRHAYLRARFAENPSPTDIVQHATQLVRKLQTQAKGKHR